MDEKSNKLGVVGETTEYALSELFDLQMGKTPSRNNDDYWCDGIYKWISIADLTKTGKYISETKELLSEKAIEESGISIIPANTVVMSFKLSIGKTAITSEEMYSNEAIMSFRDRHITELIPDYIYYLLLAQRWNEGANKAVMGMTQNKATISKRKVRVHDIVRQNQIVEKLDKLQKLISQRNEQLTQLDTLIKARFVEMFGDCKSNNAGWRQKPLCSVLEDGSNVSYGIVQTGDDVDDGVPVFRPVDIAGGNKPRRTDLKRTQKEISDKYKRTLLRGYELLITVRGSIGETFQVSEEFIGCNVGRNIVPLRFDTEQVLYPFMQHLFAQKGSKETLASMTKGIALQGLNMSEFREMQIILPPIEGQREFAAFVAQVDKSKLLHFIYINIKETGGITYDCKRSNGNHRQYTILLHAFRRAIVYVYRSIGVHDCGNS